MNLETARSAFEDFLTQRLGTTQLPQPQAGFEAMLAFYSEIRATDCEIESDGDMLLFQWGTWDFGRGLRDEVSLTRQLIGPSGEDDEIWQLALTYRFGAGELLAGSGAGNHWCHSPSELASFRELIAGHPAYRAMLGRSDGTPHLSYEATG